MEKEINYKKIGDIVSETIHKEFNNLGVVARIKPDLDNPFDRVGQILRNYGKFRELCKEKIEQIKEVQLYGVRRQSAGVNEYSNHKKVSTGITLEEEIVQSIVDALERDIVFIENALTRVDMALEKVKSSPDYPMLEDYYFNDCTMDFVSQKYNLNFRTTKRHIEEMVHKMAMELFPKEMLNEMIEV